MSTINSKNVQHSPTPWVRDVTRGVGCDIRAASGRKVAATFGVANMPKTRQAAEMQKLVDRANAELIIKAVNEYVTNHGGDKAVHAEYVKSLETSTTEIDKAHTALVEKGLPWTYLGKAIVDGLGIGNVSVAPTPGQFHKWEGADQFSIYPTSVRHHTRVDVICADGKHILNEPAMYLDWTVNASEVPGQARVVAYRVVANVCTP